MVVFFFIFIPALFLGLLLYKYNRTNYDNSIILAFIIPSISLIFGILIVMSIEAKDTVNKYCQRVESPICSEILYEKGYNPDLLSYYQIMEMWKKNRDYDNQETKIRLKEKKELSDKIKSMKID